MDNLLKFLFIFSSFIALGLLFSNKFLSIFILLPKILIHKPVTTASILILFEKTDVILLGIIFTITNNRFVVLSTDISWNKILFIFAHMYAFLFLIRFSLSNKHPMTTTSPRTRAIVILLFLFTFMLSSPN
ncbi:hypothetical protein DP144_04915 [Clostridium tetani]|nr:hypothetical protein DP133_00930 [Clostridium tetani]RXM77729.1 hypothetical protein DP154_04360 [Clostridium tetani]RYU99616.1 hypothetical protein DP144_04915 [Clostridium tetani]